MRINDISVTPYYDNVLMTIAVPKEDGHKVQNLVSGLGEIKGEYDVSIKKHRNKRSKDANAYMWEMIGQIAQRLNSTADEVYREVIRNYGLYEIIPVKTENIDHWADIWASRGKGWVCEDLGECRNTAGYHNIKTYYGTSVYDTKQMARLIDGLIDDCKSLGIETLIPDEIMRMEVQDEQCNTNRTFNKRP